MHTPKLVGLYSGFDSIMLKEKKIFLSPNLCPPFQVHREDKIFLSFKTYFMKRLLIPVLILSSFAIFSACQKESKVNVELTASKTTSVKKGEPVYFSFTSPSGSSVNWSVTPSANVQMNSNGSTATLLFGKAGDYSVTANSGTFSSNRRISVLDSSFVHGDTILPHDTNYIAALTGDKIKITLTKMDSARSGFAVHAQTFNSYNCLNNYLISGKTETGSGVSISYNGVYVPASAWCSGGSKKAETTDYYFPAADGTYELKIKLNGVVYTGSFTKTGNAYTFSWPNTSAVVISPLSL